MRLEAHCGHFRKLLEEESTPGRKLNFLLQEMNREINTIGSKSSDVPIVEQVVEVKEELERIDVLEHRRREFYRVSAGRGR